MTAKTYLPEKIINTLRESKILLKPGITTGNVSTFLKVNATDLDTQFVYKAWLDAKGDIELVRDYVKAWLIVNGITLKARFVYQAWLDAKGDIELVQGHIKAWLRVNAITPEANFVYRAWLDAKGDIELIYEHLKAWLKVNEAALDTQFVYKAWLDAKGDIELVREHLEAWLKVNDTTLDAQFVYKAWLDAKGDIELVRDYIKAWLRVNGTALKARFVYQAWLDASGDIELVRDYLKAWLKVNATNLKADFVYKAWLDAGGEFAVIKRDAIAWLHENRETKEAVYLTKYISKEKDITVDTIRDFLVWCRYFPDNEDALWRLTQLGKHLLHREIGEDIVETTEIILPIYLSSSHALTVLVRGQINTLFSYLIDTSHFYEGDLRIRIDKLFLAWFRYPESFGGDLRPHIYIQRKNYFKRVTDFIISGTLDVFIDRKPLERFLNWVVLWQPQYKLQLKGMLQLLKNRYPAPGLWDILD